MSCPVLLANGCSMCYGADISDCHQTRMASAWPGVFAEMAGFGSVVNLGIAGGSNDRILRVTIDWIVKNWVINPESYLFVCIGWSGPMRREFYIEDEWRQLIPYHDYKDASACLFNRIYRELAWHECESAHRYVTQLLSLQAFLKAHNIPYLFFDAISSFHSINQDAEKALDEFIVDIDQQAYFRFNEEATCMADSLGTSSTHHQRHPNAGEHAAWAKQLLAFAQDNHLLDGKPSCTQGIRFSGTEDVKILDKKTNLPRKPVSSNAFGRVKSFNDFTETTNTKKSLLRKLFSARQKDPFIYE